MVWVLALSVALVVVSTVAIFIGGDWLEASSAKLAAHYDLPPVVQGGIVAAAGSSFPELASVVVAGLAGSFGLGIGAVVGSAVFNVLVIPALAALLSSGGVDATRTLVHKETLFYMLAVAVLFLTFALALVYNPTDAALTGTLTRLLVLVPLAVYGLYLFLQWQDTVERHTTVTASEQRVRRQWGLLAAGLLVTLVAVWLLVEAVLELGEASGVSEFLWGVTVVAAATSLPDAVVSVRAADKQRDVASIANVLGSNTFDLLVVIPVGVLIVGSTTIDFGVTAPMMGALVAATIALFVTLRTGLVLTGREAVGLLVAYGLFLAWVLAEAVGVVSVLP